jgi:hypothetical protein
MTYRGLSNPARNAASILNPTNCVLHVKNRHLISGAAWLLLSIEMTP